LEILSCAEITQSHWSSYIHEIVIDDSYQVRKRRAEAAFPRGRWLPSTVCGLASNFVLQLIRSRTTVSA
jgi:hypothetical protein